MFPPGPQGRGLPCFHITCYRVIALSHDIILCYQGNFKQPSLNPAYSNVSFRSRTTSCLALRRDVLIVMAIADTTQRSSSSSSIACITAITSSQTQAPVPSRLRLRLRLLLPLSSYEYAWLSSGSIVQASKATRSVARPPESFVVIFRAV